MKTVRSIFVFVFLSAIFIFLYIPYLASNFTLLTDYKQSTGKVVSVSANVNRKGKITGYKYQFMFLINTANPVKGFVNWNSPDHYKPGDSIPVRYAGRDPQIYEFDSARWIIYQTLLYSSLMALGLFGGFINLRDAFRADRPAGKKHTRN